MAPYVDVDKAIAALDRAYKSGNQNEIEKAEIDFLFEVPNYFELAIHYLTLEKSGIHFDFGASVIPKGTKLYRIRRYEENTDFSQHCQWTPPPSRPQNRANQSGQEALYLSVSEETCILETHIKENEKYVLGTYECVDDIKVGGFVSPPSKDSRMLYAGIALNALLIAPSRCENNSELFALLDNYFGKVMPDDVQFDDVSTKHNILLPFKFAVMNQRNQLYDITNQLCDVIREKYPDGLRYSSCYCPIETIFIESNCYNVVLYSDGIPKVRFQKSEVKTNNRSDFTSVMMAKILLNVEKKVNDKTRGIDKRTLP